LGKKKHKKSAEEVPWESRVQTWVAKEQSQPTTTFLKVLHKGVSCFLKKRKRKTGREPAKKGKGRKSIHVQILVERVTKRELYDGKTTINPCKVWGGGTGPLLLRETNNR